MIILALINIINLVSQLLTLLIFISALLSWFVSPYHPVRQFLDRLVDPMLAPIRRVIPPAGGFDFSPLILMVLILVLARILVSILIAI